MTASASAAPPLGQRPNEPVPGKDSLAHPQGRQEDGGPAGGSGDGRGTCPDCGLPFGEHPEFHAHGANRPAGDLDAPGRLLDEAELGGDPAEA